MTLPPLKEVIARHDLRAKKSLGQNFLLDLNLTAKIARAAGDLSRGTTIEIGPGPGGLTRALLEAGAQVIAIEKDARCQDALAEIAAHYPGRLEVIGGDALALDAASLGEAPRRIVANLPYNVATPLLIGWLRRIDAFESLTLMFQREVAERLTASPGTHAYGRLSVIAQWRAQVKRLFDIAPRAFTPPPKVVSSVVQFRPRADAPEAEFALLERVTAAAFGQRRKMLRASLKSLGDAAGLLAEAGLEPTARAEEIPIEGFCALARALAGSLTRRAGD
ncbi:MAG: 16S rRNA (adenine(1518)-N(6)/adenine(1519)-N(6))-dimethyltransferase RsmA [Rhodospirillales bacterium]|nr:16S rRNA (adenine(1518)-N(6)/adenine(1519)-N(6))-dimethyltransferase RsmA [Rhodospirillales bacterium]